MRKENDFITRNVRALIIYEEMKRNGKITVEQRERVMEKARELDERVAALRDEIMKTITYS